MGFKDGVCLRFGVINFDFFFQSLFSLVFLIYFFISKLFYFVYKNGRKVKFKYHCFNRLSLAGYLSQIFKFR